MANEGVIPVLADNAVGRVRMYVGDTAYTTVSSTVGDFTYLSDAEITAFLSLGANSELIATAYALLSLASQAALESKSVKDYDLQIDLTKRAGDLRASAAMFFDRAENGTVENEYFDIVTTGHYQTTGELVESELGYPAYPYNLI